MSLKSMPVMRRLILVLVIVLAGTLLLSMLALHQYRARMEMDYQRAVRSLVEVAHGVVAHHYELERSGVMDRAAAQRAATATLRALRYDGSEYFWVNDSQPMILMHPIKPELENKNLGELKDANGKLLFREFARVAGQQPAGGFVDYVWPKPGAADPQPKLSFVKKFEPWDWIIGSGIYVDDISAVFMTHLYQFAGIVLGLMVVLFLVVWRVVGSIVSQLGGEPAYAVEIMHRVASGDLSVDVRAAGDPDSLLAELAQMVGKLRSMVGEIAERAENLAGHARDLSGIAKSVASSTHGQSDAASSIAAAVEEMSTSIASISDGARETEENSERAATLAGEGAVRADEAAHEMGAIATTVDQAASKIQQLVERAREIGSIANVIKEIAAQTNLLALNAAIEAARAGEQGRGFAVVADEVRGLAERTAAATVQIEQMISSIQAETRDAVDVMERVAGQVQEGGGLVQGAADSLRDIRGGTELALTRIRDVAEATREQTSASTSIAQQVEQIAQQVEGTSQAMQSAVSAVQDLERLASGLRELVGRFRY